MDYQNYIDLGFERTEMNDSVEFKQTGYPGFSLQKKLNDKISISVSSGELNEPRLYIKKSQKETFHILKITPECCVDLCNSFELK